MCNATVTRTADGWMVKVNGEFYGEYKTQNEAQAMADSFRGQLAN